MGRIKDLLDRIEAGETVDFERFASLQPLEIAAAAERFSEEAIERSRQADDDMESLLKLFEGESNGTAS